MATNQTKIIGKPCSARRKALHRGDEKKCTACNQWKPKSEFYKCRSHWDGLQYACKRCQINQRVAAYVPTGNKPGGNLIGSKCKHAKLNEDDVYLIKRLLATNITMAEIASKFEVSCRTIQGIKYGETWCHVGDV